MRSRRTSPVRIALTAVGLALFAGLVVPSSLRSQPERTPAAEGPMGFLRCPECGLEMPSPERQILCPRCGQKKVAMVFSTTRGAGLPESSSYNWRFPLTVGGVVVVLAAALLFLNRRKKPGEVLQAAEVRERLRQDAERARVVRQQAEYEYRAARKRKGKR